MPEFSLIYFSSTYESGSHSMLYFLNAYPDSPDIVWYLRMLRLPFFSANLHKPSCGSDKVCLHIHLCNCGGDYLSVIRNINLREAVSKCLDTNN